MYSTVDPAAFEVCIPEDYSEDFGYFTGLELPAACEYLKINGYVVLRSCVDRDACDGARRAFETGVKPYRGFLSRQTGSNAQKHILNEQGFLMNPILNVQDIPAKLIPQFRQNTLVVICNEAVKKFFKVYYGEDPAVVQTMYFEGNSETWPHQDTYYLDSEKIGSMQAAWYALEDISPGAGRFFVYEKSHLIDVRRNGGDFDIAFNHKRYKELIVDIIKSHDLKCKAPALRRGDVLIWNSKTIHGSLRTTQPKFSRSSLTAHFIPESHRFLQFQNIDKKLNYRQFNGWKIHHPKPLDEWKAKLMIHLESNFPSGFSFLKKTAIKLMLSQ